MKWVVVVIVINAPSGMIKAQFGFGPIFSEERCEYLADAFEEHKPQMEPGNYVEALCLVVDEKI